VEYEPWTAPIPPEARGALVLIVNDEPARRVLFSEVLERVGFATETLSDGAVALERRFRDPVPAVIVMNWVMPVMNGSEAIRHIRAREAAEAWPRMSIVLESINIVGALAQGADADGALAGPLSVQPGAFAILMDENGALTGPPFVERLVLAVVNALEVAPGRILGLAASLGIVESTARVVLTEDRFDEVQPGDILVCTYINPARVVLFTKVVGLVTDAGGMASDAACLAREFGIPAVVGTSIATQQIKSGDRIRVNGAAGIVEILERAVGQT
jgi:CheY-like chemotaxis protein